MKSNNLIPGIRSYFKNISIDCMLTSLYFLFIPFTMVTVAKSVSLLKVVAIPILAILAIKMLIGDVKPLKFNCIHLLFALYVIFSFSELIFYRSKDAQDTTRELIFSFLTLLMISLRTYSLKEQNFIETIWVFVGIMCIYLSLFHSRTNNQFENRRVIEIFGYHEDPNQFCAYYIFPIMICLKRIIYERKLKILYLVLILLMFYCVFDSGSRGGLIGILVGVSICIFLAIHGFKQKIVFIFIAIFGVLVFLFFVFPILPADVRQRYSIAAVLESGGTGRFDIWNYTINYITENPERLIRGSGILSTFEIYAKSNSIVGGVAHNQFLQVLSDQGLIGFILFSLLIISAFIRNIKKNPFYSCAIIAISSFMMSLTMYTFKPYINIMIMSAMTFEELKKHRGERIKNEREISKKIIR